MKSLCLKSLGLTLSCIGMSALLIAGCGNQNNGVTTKNVNRAHPIHQNSYRGNMVQPNNAQNNYRSQSFNGTSQSYNNQNYTSQNNHNQNYRGQNVSKNAHVLQLGNWLVIEGTHGKSGMGAKSVGSERASSQASPGTNGEHQLVLNVSDPEAIAAIDRINDILTNRSSMGSNADSLLNDLSLVLQKASNATGNGSTGTGTGTETGTSGVTPSSR